MIEISEEEYLELLGQSQWLAALESTGVDNWPGYEFALEILEEWGKEDNE